MDPGMDGSIRGESVSDGVGISPREGKVSMFFEFRGRKRRGSPGTTSTSPQDDTASRVSPDLLVKTVKGATAAYTGVFSHKFGERWCRGIVVEMGSDMRVAIFGPGGDEALYEIHYHGTVYSAVLYTREDEGDLAPGGWLVELLNSISMGRGALEGGPDVVTFHQVEFES